MDVNGFNKSGKQNLFRSKGIIGSVNGYEGTVLHSFLLEADDNTTSLDSMAGCFTSENGTVRCYDATTGLLTWKLKGHVDWVGCVAANPNYAQIASACTNTALWIK
eukprot:CCRYP_003217-RA/>CCRYP_003217-RA protein AED:0.32 eAED:0.32 QI:0/0/0/1/0/0/2/0/105